MKEPHPLASISVLIADDHNLVREALAQALASDPSFSVTMANSCSGTLAQIKRQGHVDVLLLDIVMPGMNGLKSIEEFVKVNAEGAVVVFSGSTARDFIGQALTLGARGFIPKTMPLKSLATAIQLIASGQIFVPFGPPIPRSDPEVDDPDRLTARELIVLNHVSDGLTNKEIAWKVGVAEVTVKMYMRSICTKLKAKNRAHAAIIAAQTGMLQLPPHTA
jgi:two-component system nitrate/nitrite response regulator NarL